MFFFDFVVIFWFLVLNKHLYTCFFKKSFCFLFLFVNLGGFIMEFLVVFY